VFELLVSRQVDDIILVPLQRGILCKPKAPDLQSANGVRQRKPPRFAGELCLPLITTAARTLERNTLLLPRSQKHPLLRPAQRHVIAPIARGRNI
jgi:hypothetical protein